MEKGRRKEFVDKWKRWIMEVEKQKWIRKSEKERKNGVTRGYGR